MKRFSDGSVVSSRDRAPLELSVGTHHPRLPGLVRDVLRTTQTTPAALQLEITEGAALRDIPSSIKALEALAATGIQLALDDAGSDPSLLLHLRQLPLHAVKLDGKLVRRMDTDPKAAALVEEIINLAHQRDMKVIALGVETEEQLALVRERQCDEAQGYLFHRAAPAEVFTSLLQEGRCLAADSLPGDSAPVESAPSATRS